MNKLITQASGFSSQNKTSNSIKLSDSKVRKTKRYSLIHDYRNQIKTQNAEQRIAQQKLDSIKVNKSDLKKHKLNIFNSEYLKSLQQSGFKNCEQTKKFNIPTSKQIQNVSYVRYQSQPKIQTLNIDSNHFKKPESQKEQIFKQDKNVKFMKFKITLKHRQAQNNSHISQNSKPIAFKSSNQPKSFLTQIKTQMSNKYKYKAIPDINQTLNKQSIRILPESQLKVNLQKKQISQSERIKYHSNPFRSKMKKLNQFSNLNQSIENYQTKRQLLEQLQSLKNYQQKYGKKYFQRLMRNQFQEIQKHHNFTYKIKHKELHFKPTNQFIQRLYTQRPEILHRKNIASEFKKIKGRRLTQVYDHLNN